MKKQLLALAMAGAMLLGGCQPTYNENDPNYPGTTQPEQNDTHGDTENKDNQYDSDYGVTGDENLGNENNNVPTAAGVDVEKLAGLSTESKDWGPGGPKDEKNRSQGSLLYNKTYGQYDAIFLKEDSNEVYLTFDEGYEFGLSGQILDTLKEKGVKAIFFITGDFAKAEPELVQRMIDEGHVVGNHSWKHPNYSGLSVEEAEQEDVIKVAVIGKPNVGKSSLVNRILGQERVIVSDVAGTPRDAVDSPFENGRGKYLFIDTAGMRKKSRVDDRIEKFSVLRATMAIERSDVCLIMIDAREGVTEQDTKVAGLAHEAGKACIIVVNKWDLVEKDGKTMDKMRDDIRRDLSYMTYAPILFISAATGQRVPRLFEMINYVHNQSCMRISTGMLNNILADAQTRVQPPTDRGRRLKIYYMTQVGVCPPHFVVFCNERKLFHFSYQRYLENCIRNVFGLEGTPVIMSIREKGDKED